MSDLALYLLCFTGHEDVYSAGLDRSDAVQPGQGPEGRPLTSAQPGRSGRRWKDDEHRRCGILPLSNRLLLPLHEPTYQRRNLICFGIQREVSCLQHMDLRIRHVLVVAFWLARIEREIMLAPDD